LIEWEIQSQRQHQPPDKVNDRKNAHNNECMRVLDRDQVDSQGYDAGEERRGEEEVEAEGEQDRECTRVNLVCATNEVWQVGKFLGYDTKCINNVPYVRARRNKKKSS
jgi:hypothetical protein